MSMSMPPLRPGPPARANQQSWWSRNWKWFVPAGCLGGVLLVVGFVAAIVFFVFGLMRSSEPYRDALAAAKANPQVIETLGEPVEAGWWMSGNINVNGSSGEANIAIPVSGPEGSGTIYVVAEKSAGVWAYDVMEIAVEGEAERIDLRP